MRAVWGIIEFQHTRCEAVLVALGAHVPSVSFGGADHLLEVAVAVRGNQFIKEARFLTMPSEELRGIRWRSPSLQKIVFEGGLVTRKQDSLAIHLAVQPGDRVRVLDTNGDSEVERVVGEFAELEGREGTVPIDHLVFAGQAHVAWQEANAAEARGQSNVITQVLSRSGFISKGVRARVDAFL